MQITEELIRKFLEDRCDDREAAAVMEYLIQRPGEFRKHLGVSWDEAAEGRPLTKRVSQDILREVRQQIGSRTIQHRLAHFRWIGIAASLLLVIGLCWLLADNSSNKVTSGRRVANGDVRPAIKWLAKDNPGKNALRVVLEDGSVVTLSPKAAIRYSRDIGGQHTRDVYLNGEAFFDVAKDRNRPFTVHAGLFSTTALGTSFLVTEDSSSCRVRLYTGKVVITARRPGLEGWSNDVFLVPGQQMQYDMVKRSMALTAFQHKTTEGVLQEKNDMTGKKGSKSVLEFENASLSEVLMKLSAAFNRKIEYNTQEIEGMYFTGSVLKNDSLPGLLGVIARMNGLTVTEKAGGFFIQKSK